MILHEVEQTILSLQGAESTDQIKIHYIQASNNKLLCSSESLLFLLLYPCPSHLENTTSMPECSKSLQRHTLLL